jgi:ribosome maturation protein Sdo1
MRLRLLERIPDATRVEVEVGVPALAGRTLQGQVLRSGELKRESKQAQEYWVAVQFVGVDEGLRKEMTQLVFDIEREHLRKSLS